MLIKKADDRSADIETLKTLSARPDVTQNVRKLIDREIRNIQSGMRGEAEAAYEMEFYYGASKNWMIVHDLRLECDGRAAQIDHLLISRFLEIYVCESKRFSEGVAINEQGEFSAFFGSKPYGIPSPLEQNRRHMAVLSSVLKTELVALPKRLGLTISPSLHGLILVSKTARISRPKAKIDGIETIIKNDQLKATIDRNIDKDNNILSAAKIVGQDTLENFALRLVGAHKPIQFDWAAKFGLPTVATAPAQLQVVAPVSSVKQTGERKSKLACSSCETVVAYNVAKFCWFNKPRFGGKVFCMECQKTIPNL